MSGGLDSSPSQSKEGESPKLEQTPPVLDKIEDPEAEKSIIRESLLRLNGLRLESESLEDALLVELGLIEESISALEKQYPNDPDLQVFRHLYEDLSLDIKQRRRLKFDTGFEELVAEVQNEITESGAQVEPVDNPKFADIIGRLRKLGINPKYIVTQGNPQAKTVVYFMQTHPSSDIAKELLDAAGVPQSQEEIYDAIVAAADDGLVRDIYGEGFFATRNMGSREKRIGADLSYVRALDHLGGDRLNVVGMEDEALMISSIYMGGMQELYKYRITAQNILLASNVANNVKGSTEDVSFAVLGAMHESLDMEGGEHRDHPLPFSQALARHGVNVVVVDASSQYFDHARFQAILANKKKQEILAAMKREGKGRLK